MEFEIFLLVVSIIIIVTIFKKKSQLDFPPPLRYCSYVDMVWKNKTRRYKLVKDFRLIQEGDRIIRKNGKTYYWRPTWKDAYMYDLAIDT